MPLHLRKIFHYIESMQETIDESNIPEPPLGSHLISPRTGFNHHGLYAGKGKVIHYSGMARTLSGRDILKLPHLIHYGCVVKTSLKRFCDGHGFRVQEHPRAKFVGEAAVERAKKRLYERSYYLFGNNCEHFVNWCIDDTFKSRAVTRMLFLFAFVGFVLHVLGVRNGERVVPGRLRSAFRGIFSLAGSFTLTHFTLGAMQPAEGIRGRERRNRRFGRIGAWAGFVFALLFAFLRGRKGAFKLFDGFVLYFLPVVAGVGTYGIARFRDTVTRDALRKKRLLESKESSAATDAPAEASQ